MKWDWFCWLTTHHNKFCAKKKKWIFVLTEGWNRSDQIRCCQCSATTTLHPNQIKNNNSKPKFHTLKISINDSGFLLLFFFFIWYRSFPSNKFLLFFGVSVKWNTWNYCLLFFFRRDKQKNLNCKHDKKKNEAANVIKRIQSQFDVNSIQGTKRTNREKTNEQHRKTNQTEMLVWNWLSQMELNKIETV